MKLAGSVIDKGSSCTYKSKKRGKEMQVFFRCSTCYYVLVAMICNDRNKMDGETKAIRCGLL